MGIPSYYRFLCQKNKYIISNDYLVNGKTVLCFDFNCIVYYCLSKMEPYDENSNESYERNLINEVCKYVEHIYVCAKKPSTVFISVDGVVPMAKMKQQRMRRFKGLFMEPYEFETGARSISNKSWDKNSITPGTVFMKKLDVSLKELCSKHSGWTLSGFNDPGEGEHKIMNYIRNFGTNNNTTFIVYGLDADLILLSMLQWKQTIFLMREEVEFNNVILDHNDKEQFLYLNIHALNKTLFTNPLEVYIKDYVMMMSLLGNDFLPHSISFTIKDGGYVLLLNKLREFHKQNKFLLTNNGFHWINLKDFIGSFMDQESYYIERMCKKKTQIHSFRANTEYERKMASVYALPCKWNVEQEFYENGLKVGWQDIYYNKFIHNDKNSIIKEYIKGLQWIYDYYNGNAIEYDWYYPYMYTPLWNDIYNYLDNIGYVHSSYNKAEPLTPEQQLVLVLPIESFNLIPNQKYKTFPSRFPQYYPSKFSVHSLGKKWIYECESNIPMLTSKFLRKILV